MSGGHVVFRQTQKKGGGVLRVIPGEYLAGIPREGQEVVINGMHYACTWIRHVVSATEPVEYLDTNYYAPWVEVVVD